MKDRLEGQRKFIKIDIWKYQFIVAKLISLRSMRGNRNLISILKPNKMIICVNFNNYKFLNAGEMLVGPANALFMDEISTGLDSSTTYQILNSLKQCVHILKGTAVISLNFNEISIGLDSSTTYCSLLHFKNYFSSLHYWTYILVPWN